MMKKHWAQKARRESQAGQTIIEVLIATLVVGMVLTAVAATLTVSVKNTAQSRYQEVARTRAQSGLEVFRQARNTIGWGEFSDKLGTGIYCLNSLPVGTDGFLAMPSGACSDSVLMIGTDFVREAYVTQLSPDEIRVELAVGWIDGTLDKEVRLTQVFRRYESEE